MDVTARAFRNITLSFRGSERQAPNALQLALRFSRVMEARQDEGKHLATMSAEDRLRDVISDFNSNSAVQAKHRLDDDKVKAILHLISGTSVVS